MLLVCREAALRPLRELWGGRLLAGGSRHALLQQRLIEAVARGLRTGSSEGRVSGPLAAGLVQLLRVLLS